MGGRILLALTLPLGLIALVVGIVRLVTASALDRFLVAIQMLLWDAPAIPRAEAAADASREVSV